MSGINDNMAVQIWTDIVTRALKLNIVKVDRAAFLKKELSTCLPPDKVAEAIRGDYLSVVPPEVAENLARHCIKYHLTAVTSASALAGIPGGWALAGVIPADLAQFYGHIFSLTQKLMYLYGYPEVEDLNDNGIEDELAQILTLFLGVMSGTKAVEKLSIKGLEALSERAVVYPIVKNVARWLGVNISKKSFSEVASKAVPLIGAPISGGLTYWTFKPMANKLHRYLIANTVFR